MSPSALSRLLSLCLLGLMSPGTADAFTANIGAGSRAVYLRVGDGNFSARPYSSNGAPIAGTTGARNVVTLSVPAAAVGNGTRQDFTGDSRGTSDWDGYAFCNPGQTYIGGFYRAPSSVSDAVLTATVTAPLSNGTSTIPFSKISWTSSGNGELASTPQPIPAGSFGDSSTMLASFPENTWRESCHSFSYLNDQIVASGTYQGTITYTLSAP